MFKAFIPLVVLLLFSGLCLASGTSSRTLPTGYEAGQEVLVEISITPNAGSFSSAVEDTPPTGWTISDISDNGTFDQVNGRVKWVFLDGDPRTLSYKASPPQGTSGTYSFSGIASFDGQGSEVLGDSSISEAASSNATRSLPGTYTPASAVAVTLSVNPPEGVSGYAVEDGPPTGWTPSSISDGGTYDSINHKVKWVFLDGSTRNLSYSALPPASESGAKFFTGQVSFDGQPSAISGNSQIDLFSTPTRVISVTQSISFGPVTLGTSQTATLTITNSGNSELRISGISHSSGDFSGNFSGVIAAGQSQQVTITFTPSAVGDTQSAIEVLSDATSGLGTASTSGTGRPVPTRLISLSGDIAFGVVEVGQPVQAALTITNSGNSDLNISGITSTDSTFSSNFSGIVSAGTSQLATVTFAPNAAGVFTGTLEVLSNATGGISSAAVSGAAAAPGQTDLASIAAALNQRDFFGLIDGSGTTPERGQPNLAAAGFLKFKVRSASLDGNGDLVASAVAVRAIFGGANYRATTLKLDAQGSRLTGSLSAKGREDIELSLTLSVLDGKPVFNGLASVGEVEYPVTVYRESHTGRRDNRSPMTRLQVNCVLEADLADSLATGHGFCIVKFQKDGSARISGRLPDNTAFRGVGYSIDDPITGIHLLLLARLPRGAGLIFGQWSVNADPSQNEAHLSGATSWVREPDATSPISPTEFTLEFTTTGLAWSRLTAAAIPSSSFTLSLDIEDVTSIGESSIGGTWPATNRPVLDDPNGTKLRFNRRTGTFTIRFPRPQRFRGLGIMLPEALDIDGTPTQGFGFIPPQSGGSGTVEIVSP